MGGGSWNHSSYTARSAAKSAAGEDTFAYSSTTVRSTPRSEWTAHDRLDPKTKAGEASPHAGQIMRECMISDEHPDPTAIAVLFDVTGSMHRLPRIMQGKLPNLHGLLVRKGYAADPQIMFGAIGDAYSDRVPLQVGQFESDNRMDEDLEAVLLEGGGGGGNHESYDLGLYYLARHTYLDAFEKNGKKGYAFIIGDERAYPKISRQQVQALLGDADSLQEDIPIQQIIAEVAERYHLFYLFASEGSYDVSTTLDDTLPSSGKGAWGSGDGHGLLWRPLLGQNAIELASAEAVCETVALQIGLMEGSVTLDDGLDDLKESGLAPELVAATGKSLATVGAGGGGAVATSSGDLPGLD